MNQKVTNPTRVSNAYIHIIENWFIAKEWDAIYDKDQKFNKAKALTNRLDH